MNQCSIRCLALLCRNTSSSFYGVCAQVYMVLSWEAKGKEDSSAWWHKGTAGRLIIAQSRQSVTGASLLLTSQWHQMLFVYLHICEYKIFLCLGYSCFAQFCISHQIKMSFFSIYTHIFTNAFIKNYELHFMTMQSVSSLKLHLCRLTHGGSMSVLNKCCHGFVNVRMHCYLKGRRMCVCYWKAVMKTETLWYRKVNQSLEPL